MGNYLRLPDLSQKDRSDISKKENATQTIVLVT